ncbi:AraC family transcriptional regulator [Methylobacterium ajmalii]|uniref:AraC family transcriptional regulator n=1 Tax=Methylobacterium ajmalii TaxID=2738439 RepID=A0ABU9ZXS8_9HYPH
MTSDRNTISADFDEYCKSLRGDNRKYLSEFSDLHTKGIITDNSFGLLVGEGVSCFLIDTIFNNCYCTKSHYGNSLRIMFYLNKSILSDSRYGVAVQKLGDALLVKDNRELSFYPKVGMHVFGLNIIIDPKILPDIYGLDMDNVDFSIRHSLMSRHNIPFATKIELPARLFGLIDSIERCVSKGLLQNRLLKAKSEEIICEIINIMNNSNNRLKHKKERLTRNQIITQKIYAVAHYYEQNMCRSMNLDDICQSFGMNKNILIAGFKELYGMTPGMYARKISLEWAREQINTGIYRVQEVAILSGYNNASAFSRAYKAFFGVSPANDEQDLI